MARRYADPTLLLAEDALLEWYALAEQLGQDDRGRAAAERRGSDRVLRWHVSERLGLPLTPFTVWRREPRRADGDAEVQLTKVRGRRVLTFAEPLIRVEVDLVTGGGTGVAMAFGPGPAEVALLLDAGSGGNGDTLVLHGPAVQRVVVIGADVGGWRVESLAAALGDESWEPFERVGLPAFSGESSYEPEPQGIVGGETDGPHAAVQRLERAAPPIGWPASTPTGRGAPAWTPVAPAPFVDELRAELLAGLLRAFDGRSPHELRRYLRREATEGPRTAVGASRLPSSVSLPVLATSLLAAEVDLPVALALGLATGYPAGRDGELSGFDLMVSGEYPWVPGRGRAAEVATVAPWPPLSDPVTGPPTGVATRHSGPVAPPQANRPWTTVVSTSWNRVRPSLTLDRPVAAAHGRFPPDVADPVTSLLDERPSGGPRPLAITPLPSQPDRVGVADHGVELPVDATVARSGHAVSVCDGFGVWSPWRETVVDLPPMPVPFPTPTNAVAEAAYAGSPLCRTNVAVDVLVDQSTNSAAFVEVRGWLVPAPYAGAPVPAGVAPGAGVPTPGAVSLRALLRSSAGGFVPEPAVSCELEELAEDGGNTPLPAVRPPRRRWRVKLPAVVLDYGAVPHWTLALWARAVVSGAGWSRDGGPAVSSVSSPVPPVVTVMRPPVPPLGSAPDAEGRSHVEVPLPPVPGAARVTVWTVSETTLVPGALGAGAGPPPPGLAERYAALRGAVGTTGETRRSFTRLQEVAPGTPSVDIALSRGSREIHLFAVTAVNPANVESDWPASAEAMWAAVAPQVVAPEPPVVTTTVSITGAVTVTVSARARLPVAAMALYATRSWDVARDVASMGPMLPMPLPTQQPDPPPTLDRPAHPAGPRWESTVVLPRARVEGWRGLHMRAVARPVAAAPDLGMLGVDSPPSEVVTVTVPPAGLPQLSPLAATSWGAPPDGVVVRFDAIAPLAVSRWGPHTLAARAVAGAVGLVDLPAAAVGSIPLEHAEPVAATPLPVLVRAGPAAAGRQPFALWFRRPDRTVPVDVTVLFSDPLGGVSVGRLTVPPASAATPPDVSIVSAKRAPGMVVVDFETAAPITPVSDGAWQLTVRGIGFPGPFFSPISRTMNVIDIPLVSDAPPSGEMIEVFRFPGGSDRHSYRARMNSPFLRQVFVRVRAPDGSSVEEHRPVS